MESCIIPDCFGEYVTLRDHFGAPVILGSGGFGTTVRACRTRTLHGAEFRDDCAVKILKTAALEDEKRRRAFIEEIRASRDLQHQNLVQYIDCGEQDGSIFLVMDLCRGGDLERLVRDFGTFSERATLHIGLQICAGLEEAHNKKYLHRDLKPRNILLSESVPPGASMRWLEEGILNRRLKFKVADFGLIGRLGGSERRSGFVGSPMFASPEQVRERRDLDERSDIYSLGMSLWFLMVGHGPLVGPDGRVISDCKEAMMAHTSPTPHEAHFPPTWSPDFRELLRRMVQKSRSERFANVDELSRAIRDVLDRPSAPSGIPAPAESPIAVSVAPPVAEPRQPVGPDPATLLAANEWGAGSIEQIFDTTAPHGEIGRRPMGKVYQAGLRSPLRNVFGFCRERSEVLATVWPAGDEPDDEREQQLAEHLGRIWAATRDPAAPRSVTRILDARRTASAWAVTEEWVPSVTLEDLLGAMPRRLTTHEIAKLLMPIAEAGDFLHQKGLQSALLTLDDIRASGDEVAANNPAALRRSLDSWSNFAVHVSAVTLPPGFVAPRGTEPTPDMTGSDYTLGIDAGQLSLAKSFCRLLYRIVEGAEPPVAANWDAHSYEAAAKLSAASNALLRDCIRGTREEPSLVDLLYRFCRFEGIYNAPERSSIMSGSGGSSMFTSLPATESVATETVDLSTPAEASHPSQSSVAYPSPRISQVPPTASTNLPPQPPAAPSRLSPHTSIVRPPSDVSVSVGASVSYDSREQHAQMETATVVNSLAGLVRSPYGSRREQRISGPNWRPNARIYCSETNRLFKLPEELPPLEARLIPGRFDAVHSPYREAPSEVPVPAGRWIPGEEFNCSFTGLPMRLPEELPQPVAALVAGKPGYILSPYEGRTEVPVEPTLWQPEMLVRCPFTNQNMRLPAKLPALEAIPIAEVPSCFESPYARGRRFTLPPHECVPGLEFECEASHAPLVVPAALPATWIFEGLVRQGDVPEAQSPFLSPDLQNWQPLSAQEWRPGAAVRCRKTGREFVLPGALPTLLVQPAEHGPAIISPFGTHEVVPISAANWRPRAEFSQRFPGAGEIKVVLADGALPPLLAKAAENAGAFISPYAPDRRFTLAAQDCMPGATVACPWTNQPLVLPDSFPATWRFEGAVRQVSGVPEVRSPFVAEEAQAWRPLTAGEWRGGQVVRCAVTNREFLLPATLPVLEVEQGPRSPSILSPFPPKESISVSPTNWRPLAEVNVRLSSGVECRVRLPQDVLPLGPVPAGELANVPLGQEPSVRGLSGVIRSPYADRSIEVPAQNWVTGNRLVCPQTQRPFWLPADLPPLPAAIGPKPGTVYSPYTGRVVEIPAWRWQSGETFECEDTHSFFVLPENLPLLVGRVDANRPGEVESPYCAGEFFPVERENWVGGGSMSCPRTRRTFSLPQELPEWIAEAEVVNASKRQVRSPYGRKPFFYVAAEEWEPGGIVACPQTGEHARLPADLPPLEATLVPDKPGCIVSPYLPSGAPQRLKRTDWRPGQIVLCAATGRKVVLPQILPPMPSGVSKAVVLVGAIAALLIVGSLAALYFAHPGSSGPTVSPGSSGPSNGPGPRGSERPGWPSELIVQSDFPWSLPAASGTLPATVGKEQVEVPYKVDLGKLTLMVQAAVSKSKKAFENVDTFEVSIAQGQYEPIKVAVRRGDARAQQVQLKNQVGIVKVDGSMPYYDKLIFSPLEGAGTELAMEVKSNLTVPVGKYAVALTSKDAISFPKYKLPNPIEVARDHPGYVKLTPPFPPKLGGFFKREFTDIPAYVFRDSAHTAVPVDGTNIPIISVAVITPMLVAFDDDGTFRKGRVYEESSLAMDAIIRALDGLCHVAIGQSSYVAKTDYSKAPAAPKIKSLAAAFFTALELPLDSATDQQIRAQRQKLRETATGIRNLVKLESLPPDTVAFLNRSNLPGYEDFIAIMDSSKDEAWVDFVRTCRSGTGGQVSQALMKGPKDRNLLFENPFQVGGFEAGNLDISIQRKFYKLDPAEWKARLSVGERPATWRFDSREGKSELKGVQ